MRASGPPGRRIFLFNYDASRAGAVPKRLLEGYRGILVTDGYEAYDATARTLNLATFLTHGDVPLDNNRCENAIRPLFVGRKGWLLSDTVKGAIASANLYFHRRDRESK